MRRGWLVTAALALIVSGCTTEAGPGIATAGDGTTAASPTVSRREMGRLLAACLREQGLDVADPPDDGPKADVVLPHAGVDKQKFTQGMEKCRQYAPDAGPGKNIDPADLEALRRHSRCMREQGFPDWPDPDPHTGAQKWDDPEKALAAKNHPRFREALAACRQHDILASPRP